MLKFIYFLLYSFFIGFFISCELDQIELTPNIISIAENTDAPFCREDAIQQDIISAVIRNDTSEPLVLTSRACQSELLLSGDSVFIQYNFKTQFLNSSSPNNLDKIFINQQIPSSYINYWELSDSVRTNTQSLTDQFLNGERPLDPFSAYFPPAVAEETITTITTSSAPGSVGIRLAFNDTQDTLTVLQVAPNSPASDQGVLKRDRIININSQDVTSSNINLYFSLTKELTNFNLQLLRGNEIITVPITKRTVRFPTILIDTLESHAYIRIFGFSKPTITLNGKQLNTNLELEIALNETSNFEVTLLDLRNNGGGLLDQALNMVDQFLTNGNIISLTTRSSSDIGIPEQTIEFVAATPNGIKNSRKFILLTNGGTASASEIFVSALNEGLGIDIIGQKTFGKAIGQQLINTPNQGLFLLTTLRIASRNGIDYNGTGINPTVVTNLGLELNTALNLADQMAKSPTLLKRKQQNPVDLIPLGEGQPQKIPLGIFE